MSGLYSDPFDLRAKLTKSTKSISDERDLSESLTDFVAKQSDVEYRPEDSRPIYADGRQWQANTWLLRFGCFERDGHVYSWIPSVELAMSDGEYDYYFALRWKQIDVFRSSEFLRYHFERSATASKGDYCTHLRKLRLKHSTLLPESLYVTPIDEYEKMDQPGNATEEIAGAKFISIRTAKVTR